jgi:hypothetical protein
MRAHSREWARWVQLGLWDLQLFERCIADDVKANATVDQHVVELVRDRSPGYRKEATREEKEV